MGTATLHDDLAALCGREHVLVDEPERFFYGADFSDTEFPLPAAIVRPGDAGEIAAIVQLARRHRLAVVGRGGGMSYTRAHVPDREGVIVIDTGRLNRIVEVNALDRYVVVEVGVTWAQLFDAVHPTGMWVPHLGTLSGLHATVGGGLSQQVAGLGNGYLTDYVLGLEVVLGDGTTVRTGSWAASGTAPIMREFGPDLNGLFLVDSGAMGIKTRAALRLDPMPGGTSYGMYSFTDHLAMVDAMVEIGRTGLATNVIGSDAVANKAMASMPPPPREVVVGMAKQVMASGTSKWRAARQLAKTAKGKGIAFLADVPNALLLITDGPDTAAADRAMHRLHKIAKAHGGTPLPIGPALGMRMSPFNPIFPLMFGPRGEATIPSNAMVPLSKARELATAVDSAVAERRGDLDAAGVFLGNNYLVTRHVFGVEPLINYPSRPSAYRLAWVPDELRSQFEHGSGDVGARALALALRGDLLHRFRELGAVHIQIGRTYPLREALDGNRTWQLLTELKALVDPDGVINPGVLQLDVHGGSS